MSKPDHLSEKFILTPWTRHHCGNRFPVFARSLGIEFMVDEEGQLVACPSRRIGWLESGQCFMVLDEIGCTVPHELHAHVARAMWESRYKLRHPPFVHPPLGRISRFFDPARLP